MKKHLVITCLAYFYWGFGVAVQMFGIKADLGLYPTLFIFISSWVIFIITAFTSLQKVKEKLLREEKIDKTSFDFENKPQQP